jgi:hypothetical protein
VTRWLTVAEMTARDLVRRRAALGLLFTLPLAFYLARHDRTGQSIRFASLGLGFAVSTVGLFAGTAAKSLEPRLRIGGYRTRELVAGRLGALLAIGLAVAALYLAIILVDQPLRRPTVIALELAVTTAVAAPLGLLLSALVPRDLEGTLLLITLVGVQFIMDPVEHAARLLPFWSMRELGTYAVDLTDAGYLRRGLAHGIATTILLTAATAVLATLRLRRRPHLRLEPQPPSSDTRRVEAS